MATKRSKRKAPRRKPARSRAPAKPAAPPAPAEAPAPVAAPAGELWPPEQRLIFHFHDGHKPRAVDPLAVHRALVNYPNLDLDADCKIISIPAPASAGLARASAEALERVLAAVRSAFQVKPLDDEGKGLTDTEALELFCRFGAFVKEVTNEHRPFPTSSASAAGASSPGPPLPGIEHFAVSTGTDTAPSTAPPTPSPSASASPSAASPPMAGTRP